MSLSHGRTSHRSGLAARIRAGLSGRTEGGRICGAAHQALEIEKLKFQIAKLRRMQFGRSSERVDRQIAQLELRLEELEAGMAEESPPAPKPRLRSRRTRSTDPRA